MIEAAGSKTGENTNVLVIENRATLFPLDSLVFLKKYSITPMMTKHGIAAIKYMPGTSKKSEMFIFPNNDQMDPHKTQKTDLQPI